MSKNWPLIFCLFTCLLSCGTKDSESNYSLAGLNIESTIKDDHNSDKNVYDGFYLSNWNKSGAIVIYNGKIHHFTRQQPQSIYKDEEYDYSSVADGFLMINRTYRLDRNDKVVSKETILKDIRPIVKDDSSIALERNGRTFEKIKDLADFLTEFNWDLTLIVGEYSEEWAIDQIRIEEALKNTEYYKNPILTEARLRDGEISFKEILRKLVD